MLNIKKKIIFLVLLSFICTCTEESQISEPEESEGLSGVVISSFPYMGTIGTKFDFSVTIIGDSSFESSYQVKYDWDNDGTYDTDWIDSLKQSHSFSNLSEKIIKVLIRDASGKEGVALDTVYVNELVQITQNISSSSQGNVDWSTDGSNKIAFDWRPGAFEHQIYVMEYPNGTPERITLGSDNDCHQFAEWSPDGNKVAYLNNTKDQIEIIDLATKTVSSINVYPRFPLAWSPDGKGFLIKSMNNLQYLDIASGVVNNIISEVNSFCWSPDGSTIAFVKEGIIKFQNFNSGAIIKEYDIPASGSKLEWSRNGKLISLGVEGGVIYVLNYNTGHTYSIRPDSLSFIWYPTLSKDNTHLAFEGRKMDTNDHFSIWAICISDEFE